MSNRVLIFDPFAGISGDMTLGALVDLGLDPEWLKAFVASLQLGDIGVNVQRVTRSAISCAHVSFELPDEHAHRHLRHIVEIVQRTTVSQAVKTGAIEAFTRLATAEAAVHGTTIEKVHFHEVGALDAILDVMCALAGIRELGFETCYTRPVALGSGWVDIAHGHFPVPAPATLRLLEGLPVTGADLRGECTTPTGAAILATVATAPAPARFTVLKSGFGAGTRDPAEHPNCLRLIAAEVETGADQLHLIQADIDDLPPEYVPAAQEAMLQAGALDVVAISVGMKKGRPGLRLEALTPEVALAATLAALFRTTPTIGARHWPVQRPALPRNEEVVEWRGQRIRRKRVFLPDGQERSKPEYEDVAKAAAVLGLSPFEVRGALERGEGTVLP
jgi:uncharacterized protein (TIGR00299 family) protein